MPPHIRVDELMQRIQEEVRTRRAARSIAGTAATSATFELEDWESLDAVFARAEQRAHVGVSVPVMPRLRGLKRTLAVRVAKTFLRVAQLITRDQREFNLAALQILRTLHERQSGFASQLSAVHAKLSELEARVAELDNTQAHGPTRGT